MNWLPVIRPIQSPQSFSGPINVFKLVSPSQGELKALQSFIARTMMMMICTSDDLKTESITSRFHNSRGTINIF